MGMERTVEILCSDDCRIERDCIWVFMVDVYRLGARGCNVSLSVTVRDGGAGVGGGWVRG